jgi:hypothetical protein
MTRAQGEIQQADAAKIPRPTHFPLNQQICHLIPISSCTARRSNYFTSPSSMTRPAKLPRSRSIPLSSKARDGRLNREAELDNKIITDSVAAAPEYEGISAYMDDLGEAMAERCCFRRPRKKEAILALANKIAPHIGKEVGRRYKRRKEAAICWFCHFCPKIINLDLAVAVKLLMSTDLPLPRPRSAKAVEEAPRTELVDPTEDQGRVDPSERGKPFETSDLDGGDLWRFFSDDWE